MLCSSLLVVTVALHAIPAPSDSGTVVRDSAPGIVIQRLSPRTIALHFDGPVVSNVVALRSTGGIVVLDTESSPSLGRLLRSRILEEFPGAKIRWVVNTHGHGDHTWGNQAFAAADIVGDENTLIDMAAVEGDAAGDAQRMGSYLERLESRLKEASPNGPEADELGRTIRYYATAKEGLTDFRSTPPNVLFSERMELRAGDLTFRLISFPNAHSHSDILVFCPEEGLLATGDLFLSRMRPPYLKTATLGELPGWLDALDLVLREGGDIRYVIPGHDAFLSAGDLKEVRAYLGSESARVEGKSPAWPIFQQVQDEEGTDTALAKLEGLAGDESTFLMESDLVGLGYTFLYREEAPAKAVRVFQTLTALFPDSWNGWDCLGEASAEAGDRQLAKKAYTRSLALNPENDHATRALRELGGVDPSMTPRFE